MPAYKALVLDVDGVLTGIDSVWRYLHEHLGVWPQARMNKVLYERGEITYEEWARRDVALWKGWRVEELKNILRGVTLRPGAEELVATARRLGLKVFAISAGIDLLVEEVARRLSLDGFEANRLVIVDGVVTGEVEVTVGYTDKGRVFRDMLRAHGIEPQEAIAVGDSMVDIPMFREAGYPIAYNPVGQDLVEEAKAAIASETLFLLARLVEAVAL